MSKQNAAFIDHGAIFRLIRDEAGIVRSHVAARVGISKSTAERMAQALVDAGLVIETDGADSRRGRGGIGLSVRPESPCAVGIDLGASHVDLAAVDMAGGVTHAVRERIDPSMTREALLAVLETASARLLDALHAEGRRVLGIGFGDPGVLDLAGGVSLSATNLPAWRGVPVVAHLRERFGVPVRLEASPRVKCLGEARYGAARGVTGFLLVDLGMGVGLGMYSRGRLYGGEGGCGGELGHMVVVPDGPICACGGRGCLEAVAGSAALVRDARAALAGGAPGMLRATPPEALTARHIIEAADSGDRLAQGIVNSAVRTLGIAIGNVCNLLNPRMVVLAGGLSKAGSLMSALETVVRATVLPVIGQALAITSSQVPDTGGVLGAAELILGDFADAPLSSLAESRACS